MLSNTKVCAQHKVYLILDRSVHSYDDLLKIAPLAVDGGVDILQLRDKTGNARDIIAFSKKLAEVIAFHPVPYIINDRVDLVLVTGADGVHVGQDDLSIRDVKRLLDSDKWVGVSCQTREQAIQAQNDGADYIGFGSVFSTLTKPERDPMDLVLLEEVLHEIKIPVFPIGGITADRLALLRKMGALRVAVCRAISQAENVADAARAFKFAMEL